MRAPLSWLRELVEGAPVATGSEVATALVRLGLEEEALHGGDIGDPRILETLFPVLIELNKQGRSILLVEQMASYALAVTHRTYVMENGRVLLEGASADLATDERVLGAYLGRRPAA